MCINTASSTILPAAASSAEVVKETRALKTLQRFKRKHNLITDPTNEKKQKEVEYQPDLLAVSTQLSKAAFDLAKQQWVRFTYTKAYA